MNKLNKFDDWMHNALNEHEVPFNEASWQNIQKKLPGKSGGWGATAYIAATVTALVIVTSVVLLWPEKNAGSPENQVSENPEKVKEEIPVVAQNQKQNENIDFEKQIQTGKDETNKIAEVNHTESSVIETTITQKHVLIEEALKEDDQIEILIEREKEQIDELVNTGKVHEENLIQPATSNNSIRLNKTEFCQGEKLSIVAEGSSNRSIQVKMNGSDCAGCKEGYVLNTPGAQQVSVDIADAKGNLIETRNYQIMVHPAPEVEIVVNEPLVAARPVHSFSTNNASLPNGNWVIESRKYDEPVVEHIFRKAGLYEVVWSSVADNGCHYSVKETVQIDQDYNLLAPAGFSPNGDNINDDFMPEALSYLGYQFQLMVYDQNGTPVFTTRDANNRWSGERADGQKAQPGEIYIWRVILTNDKGAQEEYMSTVMIKPE
jgi:hypothetical protein